jgi:predicted nucleic acid-binding protein
VNLRYWDSNCFLAWLQEEGDRVRGCGMVIDAAERGKVRIVTSALTLAEVLWLRGKPPSLTPRSSRCRFPLSKQ